MSNNYDYWKAYIAGGLSKVDRPIRHNRRAFLRSNGDIALRLHSTDCVVLHPDGSCTIRTGGWNTVTTRAFLNEFSPTRVFTEKGHLRVYNRFHENTPPKIQKCRTCHGRGQVHIEPECYGPSHWGSTYCGGGDRVYPLVPPEEAKYRDQRDYSKPGMEQPCPHGKMEGHPTEPCEHGEWGRHSLPEYDRDCGRCDGTGKRDYGSKPIHFAWDGDPLTVTADGMPLLLADHKYPQNPETLGMVLSNGWWVSRSDILGPMHPDSEGYTLWNGIWVKKDAVGPAHPATLGLKLIAGVWRTPPRTTYSDSGSVIERLFPEVLSHVQCPHMSTSRCTTSGTISSTIIHLNDYHHWTREAIADWLESLDADLTLPAA